MTTAGGIHDKLDIAILHLHERDYGSAYDTLTSVLNLEPNHATALKLRAEAALCLYDKRRETAMDDIEAALRATPSSGELYLLQNQILLSRNDYPEANKRLKKAPFCVFHDDPKLSEIQDLYQMQSVRELNYLVTMPTEVTYNVMIMLPFKHRVRLLAVSKRWRETFCCIPDLWRDPDYTECRTARSASIVQSLATLMQWTSIRKLSVSLTTPIVEALVREKCRSITEVRFLRNDHVDPLVLQLAIQDIGSTWRKAEIDIAIDTALFFYAAATHCPRLTELTIHQGRWVHTLSDTMSSLMPSLKVTKLHLLRCDPPTMVKAAAYCPEIVDFTVQDSELATFRSVFFINMLHSLKHLKRLTLRSPPHVARQDADMDTFFWSLPFETLEVLDIEGFLLGRKNMLRLADEMLKGTLICYGDSFAMHDQLERNRLKNIVKEMFRDPIYLLQRDQVIEVGSDEDYDDNQDEDYDDESSETDPYAFENHIDELIALTHTDEYGPFYY